MTMTLFGMDVLLVGQSFNSAQCLIERLRRWGFRCHVASDLGSACQLLESLPIDLVLSNTRLPDGSGFTLLRFLAGLPVTIFLCVAVETSCFWLPAADAGEDCLGSPALRPAEFEQALEEMTRCLDATKPGDRNTMHLSDDFQETQAKSYSWH